MHRFIDELLGDRKLEDGKVNQSACATVFVEIHVMVCFRSHCS